MSKTKQLFEEQRRREDNADMLDADYRYLEFLKEQYPQHIQPEKQTVKNTKTNGS